MPRGGGRRGFWCGVLLRGPLVHTPSVFTGASRVVQITPDLATFGTRRKKNSHPRPCASLRSELPHGLRATTLGSAHLFPHRCPHQSAGGAGACLLMPAALQCAPCTDLHEPGCRPGQSSGGSREAGAVLFAAGYGNRGDRAKARRDCSTKRLWCEEGGACQGRQQGQEEGFQGAWQGAHTASLGAGSGDESQRRRENQ